MDDLEAYAQAFCDAAVWHILTDESDLSVDQRVELVAFMGGERDVPGWFAEAWQRYGQ